MKTASSVVIILTITPIIAVAGLVTYDPNNWGEKPTSIK